MNNAQINIRALAKTHPYLVKLLQVSISKSAHFRILKHSQGTSVLQYYHNTHWINLHSRLNPTREALRILEGVPESLLYIIVGMGMGHVAAQLLTRNSKCELLIIEPSIELLKLSIHACSLQSIFASNRCYVAVAEKPEDIEPLIHSSYLSVLHGAPTIIPLRPMVNHNRHWQLVCTKINAVLQEINANNLVHARFGRIWTRNIILNAKSRTTAPPSPQLTPSTQAVILAAGPTLDVALALALNRRVSVQNWQLCTLNHNGSSTARINDFKDICVTLLRNALHQRSRVKHSLLLIAVDSSLPILAEYKVEPDIVVSIDAQLATIHHYLPANKYSGLVIADSTIATSVAVRHRSNIIFAVSNHPLATLLNVSGLNIESSAGNVTHSAVRVAHSLGCNRIDLFGADYGYYRGKSYANGSYIAEYFNRRASRLSTRESQELEYTLGWRPQHKESGRTTPWIVPPHFIRYYHNLQQSLAQDSIPLYVHGVCNWLPQFQVRALASKKESKNVSGSITNEPQMREYARHLRALPGIQAPFLYSFKTMNIDAQRVMLSLMPLMRHIEAHPWRYGFAENAHHVAPTTLLACAKSVVLNYINRIMK